jgi:hypothetical protein
MPVLDSGRIVSDECSRYSKSEPSVMTLCMSHQYLILVVFLR